MKRQVWLNIQTGEFSNSWNKEGLSETVKQMLEEECNTVSSWKLIEYECLSDPDFEFFNQMKLR